MRFLAAVLLCWYSYVIGSLTLASSSAVAWAYGVTDRFYAMTEPEANVALFVPAAFLLAIVLLRPLLAASLCTLASVSIEWVQRTYLPDRVADLGDVGHNGLGAVVGALVAAPLVRLLSRRRSREVSRATSRRRRETHPVWPPPDATAGSTTWSSRAAADRSLAGRTPTR